MDVLLPDRSLLQFESIQIEGDQLIILASTIQQSVICPDCRAPSIKVHSTYTRKPADLPCGGYRVCLRLKVRRFFCENGDCARATFVEPLPWIVRRYARRTVRLATEQVAVAVAEGGEAGARLLSRLHMPISPDTVLRLIRQTPEESFPTPRVLGVDDWALRKGQRYGTILVDLEQRQPVDLLPDRSAETLVQWLQAHPGVEIISRDRANDYAEGASRGAPEAIQVADRFHLLQNVREMLQRLLERHESALRAAADAALSTHPAVPSTDDLSPAPEVLQTTAKLTDSVQQEQPFASPTLTKAQAQQQVHQAARRDRYETVRALHADGYSQRHIARQLEMSVHTVRRYLVADQFPERASRHSVPSKLDPFIPYLRQQLTAGQDNAMQLWRELRDQFGYSGSRPLVSRWVACHRHLCPSPSPDTPKRRGKPPAPSRPPAKVRRVSARQASWLLVRPPDELDEEDRTFVQQLCYHAVGVQLAYPLGSGIHSYGTTTPCGAICRLACATRNNWHLRIAGICGQLASGHRRCDRRPLFALQQWAGRRPDHSPETD